MSSAVVFSKLVPLLKAAYRYVARRLVSTPIDSDVHCVIARFEGSVGARRAYSVKFGMRIRKSSTLPARLGAFVGVLLGCVLIASNVAAAAADASARGRIVILMVWDGLRPDLVTARDTPNLYQLAHSGTRFDRHHSMYPTLTMVNAAALATGASPGVNGIVANTMYFAPMLAGKAPAFTEKVAKPVMLESTELLAS